MRKPHIPVDNFGGSIRGGHKSTGVEFGGVRVLVDEMLAPVLVKLWERGMGTIASCQGGPTGKKRNSSPDDRGYIYFQKERDAKWFYKNCRRPRSKGWSIEVGLVPLPEWGAPGAGLVRFPSEDLPAILARFVDTAAKSA